MVWLWKFLTSRNTGIVLLIVVSLFLLIGAALPNPALMYPADVEKLKNESPFLYWLGENFNSMKIGRGYVFGFIGILLIISTAFCSIDRVIKRMKARKGSLVELPLEGKGISVKFDDNPPNIEEKLLSILKKGRWKTRVFDSEGRRIVSAGKGALGFWGSVFFHAILITLIAGLVVYYFSGLYATMVFTEGQELRLSKDNFSKIERMPIFGITLPDLLFRFNRFSVEYYDDYTAIDYTADFNVVDLKTGKIWNQILKVNKPLRYEGIDFLIILQGYSPNFVLYKNGVPVFDSFVALNFDQDNKDLFKIEEEGMHVTAQFFPDMVRRDDGSVYSKSPRPKNPYFGLDIVKGGERVFRGLVGKGGRVTFGEYRLVFNDLRHWITLNLVRETGIGFFFLCSMIGLVGVLIRGVDPDRRIFVSIQNTNEGQTLTFYHYSKHFEGMLKENLTDIINKLKGECVRE